MDRSRKVPALTQSDQEVKKLPPSLSRVLQWLNLISNLNSSVFCIQTRWSLQRPSLPPYRATCSWCHAIQAAQSDLFAKLKAKALSSLAPGRHQSSYWKRSSGHGSSR